MEWHLLFSDFRLFVLFSISALVSLLSCTTVATRIAAVITKRVAMAFAIYNIFFLITRFTNLFYLPYMGIYIDNAERTGNMDLLLAQFRIVVAGAAFGAVAAWLLLPTFVEIYKKGIEALEKYRSLVKVGIRFLTRPEKWLELFRCLRRPGVFGVRPFKMEGVEPGFLIFNVFATAIWTVGALCALYASALHPEFKRTAVLLSGLVNSVAAIFFSLIIDPKSSLITDQIVGGKRPEKQIYVVSFYLMAGNVVGSLLAQLFFLPGARIIDSAALFLGNNDMAGSIIPLILFNVIVTLKSSTTYSSRIAAVITGRVATAFAIYNFFFLITRIAQQIYAPVIGTMVDGAVASGNLSSLEANFRWIIGGASIGAGLGFLLLPTFVEIYKKAIRGMERYNSLATLVFLTLVSPSIWKKLALCFRKPGLMGVKLSDMRKIPRNFLVANIIVISIHTIGVMAATYASAVYPDARGVTLLSSVINGVATILLSLIVDPATALITDEAVAEKRPLEHVKIMAVFLAGGAFIGTLISQIIFIPSAEFIKFASFILGKF